MTRNTTLAARLARAWLPGSAADREEVARTAEANTAGRSWRTAMGEVAGIGALGLRLRSRLATGDSPRLLLAHGASLGARLVLALTAAFAAFDSETLYAAVGIVGLLATSVITLVPLRLVLPAAITAFWLATVGPAPAVLLAGATVAVVLTAAAAAVAHPRGIASPAVPIRATIGLLGAALAAAVSTGALTSTALIALAAVAPIVLLAAGWFDPRLAVAATAVWLWRLAATDLMALLAELGDVGRELTIDVLVVRWLTMATGVIAGIVVSRQAMARAGSL